MDEEHAAVTARMAEIRAGAPVPADDMAFADIAASSKIYAAILRLLTLCKVSAKVRVDQCTFEVIDSPEAA